MRRSNLENKYLQNRTPENKDVYKKQTNYCGRLYKKERKTYYNLDLENITDNKKFWKTTKPFLTDKGVNYQKVTLIGNENILSADVDITEILNSYCSATTKSRGVNEIHKQN